MSGKTIHCAPRLGFKAPVFRVRQQDAAPRTSPLGGYDDGYDPAQRQAGKDMPRPPLSPEEITDEAVMALALETAEIQTLGAATRALTPRDDAAASV